MGGSLGVLNPAYPNPKLLNRVSIRLGPGR